MYYRNRLPRRQLTQRIIRNPIVTPDSQKRPPTRSPSPERSSIGCLSVYLSALLTAVMLVVNGSLVMATLGSLSEQDASYFSNRQLQQFLLFTGPVLITVGQWMVIDYVRTIASRKH